MKSLKVLLTVTCVALSFNASASLISPLEYNDGTKTWLTLSETVGLSMNDFRAGQGGWNTQYRLASSQEIASLLSSFGITEGDSGYKPVVPAASYFLHALGGATPGGTAGTYFDNGDQGAIGRGIGWYVWAELSNGEAFNSDSRGTECPSGWSCARIAAFNEAQLPDARNPNAGLFLIRNDSPRGVPEPSSLALLGLAGGLLALRRRKKPM